MSVLNINNALTLLKELRSRKTFGLGHQDIIQINILRFLIYRPTKTFPQMIKKKIYHCL